MRHGTFGKIMRERDPWQRDPRREDLMDRMRGGMMKMKGTIHLGKERRELRNLRIHLGLERDGSMMQLAILVERRLLYPREAEEVCLMRRSSFMRGGTC